VIEKIRRNCCGKTVLLHIFNRRFGSKLKPLNVFLSLKLLLFVRMRLIARNGAWDSQARFHLPPSNIDYTTEF
jgi:hypothetical protein